MVMRASGPGPTERPLQRNIGTRANQTIMVVVRIVPLLIGGSPAFGLMKPARQNIRFIVRYPNQPSSDIVFHGK